MSIPSLTAVAQKMTSSLRERGIGGTLKKCIDEIEELRFDSRFHVDTAQKRNQPSRTPGENNPYFPTKIAIFRDIFARLRLPYEQFTFLDLGSGKGRVLLLASELPFRRIIGVEFSQELHEVAERNIQSYCNPKRRCAAIESVCADAVTYPLPDENTVIYLFNPFKASSISRFLDHLSRSFEEPREIYLVYNSWACENLMEQCGFLETVFVGKYYSIFRNKAVGEFRGTA